MGRPGRSANAAKAASHEGKVKPSGISSWVKRQICCENDASWSRSELKGGDKEDVWFVCAEVAKEFGLADPASPIEHEKLSAFGTVARFQVGHLCLAVDKHRLTPVRTGVCRVQIAIIIIAI